MARSEASSLVEGALLAALTAVLVLIGYVIPPLMIVTSMVWTSPIVVLVIRRNLKVGVMATIVAGLLVMLVTGPVQAFLLIINFGVLGLVYGYLFKAKVGTARALIGGALAAAVSSAMGIGVVFLVAGGSFAQMDHQMRVMVDVFMDAYQRAGILEQFAQQGITPEKLRSDLIKFMRVLLPGGLVIGATFTALINLVTSRLVLLRLRLPAPDLPPFREWQLPWYMVWGVIVGLGLWLAGDYYGRPTVVAVGQNILFVYAFILMVIGLAVLIYFYKNMKLSPLMKGLLIALLILNQRFVMVALVGLGLFDTLFNYRRLTGGNKKEGDSREGDPEAGR